MEERVLRKTGILFGVGVDLNYGLIVAFWGLGMR